MNEIYGFVNFDKTIASSEYIGKMYSAIAHREPDGGGVYRKEFAAFGFTFFRDSDSEVVAPISMPDYNRADSILFVSTAKLHNRSSLCRNMAIPSEIESEISDEELTKKAYYLWKEKAGSHLSGNWALAAWHEDEMKLFLSKDSGSISKLYYYSTPSVFVFASSLESIKAHSAIPSGFGDVQSNNSSEIIVTPDFPGNSENIIFCLQTIST
ncbi:MAG: hypothetical protein HQM10_08315 [Candidatus Riflebacteria bacterium]|nr:hypothetical protein [Candidatus Riflebacteria bacterium]